VVEGERAGGGHAEALEDGRRTRVGLNVVGNAQVGLDVEKNSLCGLSFACEQGKKKTLSTLHANGLDWNF
jgi:hypothetical protein